MKVLILTDGITPFVIGGMQKHSYLLAKYLARAGVQIELHHCIYTNEKLPETKDAFLPEENKNIVAFAHRFPKKGILTGHYVRNSYKYSVTLFNEVKNRLNEFDFIYTKGFTGWKLLKEKQKGLKMPKVGVKFHGYEMFQPPADFKSKLQIKLLQGPTLKLNRWAEVVFSYGGKITEVIVKLGIPKNKIVEIPGAIEPKFIKTEIINRTDGPVKFAFVGRNERRKGIIELTEVLKQLIAENHPFQFHFIGPIPQNQQIQNNRITYHGEISQKEKVFEILDQCDVLVCPSHSEGMPNVILEGMARGLAIVATDVGAVSILVDHQNGFLVKSANKTEIYDAFLKVFKTPVEQLSKMKTHSIFKVNASFNWDAIIDHFKQSLKSKI